jgi:hypothetical protein
MVFHDQRLIRVVEALPRHIDDSCRIILLWYDSHQAQKKLIQMHDQLVLNLLNLSELNLVAEVDPEPIFKASNDEDRVCLPMQDTRRVHSELFRHLDLIEHVGVGLIDADQGSIPLMHIYGKRTQ